MICFHFREETILIWSTPFYQTQKCKSYKQNKQYFPEQIASKITQSNAYGQVVPCRQVHSHVLHRDSKILCQRGVSLVTAMQRLAQQRKSYNQNILRVLATGVLTLVVATTWRSSQVFGKEEPHEIHNH